MNETLNGRTLLLRNIRGNWSARFLHEYHFRHKEDGEFLFVNLTNLEVFPPHKPAPLFIGAKQRERLNSRFLFRNPLPKLLEQSMKNAGVDIVQTRFVHSILALMMVAKVWNVKTSQELDEFKVSGIPYGKFIHTTLIAKYGIKHFKMGNIERLRNLLIYYRFFVAYLYLLRLTKRTNVTRIVMINGRDVVGVAAQLCAFLNQMSVITLEAGFGLSPVPLYGEWQGNMHHWFIRQQELEKTVESKVNFADAEDFLKTHYGRNSRWWRKQGEEVDRNQIEIDSQYICFFTTSERETTTCPTGIPENNFFDRFDQVEQIRKVHRATIEFGYQFVIRVHPNFSNSTSARNESSFFENLARDLENTIVIPNYSQLDSYALAGNAIQVFTFRSSLSAEFSKLGISCIQTAPTAWTRYSIGQPITNLEGIKEAIGSTKSYGTKDLSDWEAFATYYSKHGKEFESLNLHFETTSNMKVARVLIQELNGLRLDIPRFNWKRKRN